MERNEWGRSERDKMNVGRKEWDETNETKYNGAK
jgi:hypothetical protein